jgi:hypothetical protein
LNLRLWDGNCSPVPWSGMLGSTSAPWFTEGT